MWRTLLRPHSVQDRLHGIGGFRHTENRQPTRLLPPGAVNGIFAVGEG
jgi:hypothetical protein